MKNGNELTDEQIADEIKSYEACDYAIGRYKYIGALKALQAERAKKDDVWKDAPEDATEAYVNFRYTMGLTEIMRDGIKHTRTQPKTLEQEIAHETAWALSIDSEYVRIPKAQLTLVMEKMLKEYAERIKQ